MQTVKDTSTAYQPTVGGSPRGNATIRSNMSLRIQTPDSESGMHPSRLSQEGVKTTKGDPSKTNAAISKIPGMKTVQEYEQEKEQEEIYKIL